VSERILTQAIRVLAALGMAASLSIAGGVVQPGGALESGFRNPPPSARLRCYWWWLNGNVTRQSITRDLEQMKAKGYGGAMIVDAGGAEQRGNLQVPAGPLFGGPEWRTLFQHALTEADRLGLEISLNIVSGWNLGGPTVQPEQSAKIVTWSKTDVTGPNKFDARLPQPESKRGFYRDIAVLAYPLHHGAPATPRPIKDLQIKGSFVEAGFSTPDTTPLLRDLPREPGEQDTNASEVQNISALLDAQGLLHWEVPAGDWEILRFGYTASDARVSTSSGDWQGLVVDYLDRSALEKYWKDVVDPILIAARGHRSLRYAATDSWELGGVNWTGHFSAAFRKHRGYDLLPFLPILSGRIVTDRATSIRFLNDLRKTIGDLAADEHYTGLAQIAGRYGLGVHPEAGGPHGAPVDALQALGRGSFPQMEYWAKAATHRVKDEDRFFVKEAASAAHIYGKTLVAAEGFTSIGPHWQESLWKNLRPTFDRALCEGLNRHIWHTFTASPKESGIPGQEYFAGTHFNPNVTWWEQSTAFLTYLNRGQFMMQQGRFVADALYYYGDHVPNFVRMKSSDPAKVMQGFDYDVVNEEVMLTRIGFKNSKFTLPGGMQYGILVLADLPNISLPVLQKVRDLVAAGGTVVGRKPERTTGLQGYPDADREVARIADEVWGACDSHEHPYGKGRIICSGTARDVLTANGVLPDFEGGALDYIHRVDGVTDIYFVSNQAEQPVAVSALFRVSGKAPELWDSVSGTITNPAIYEFTLDGRTRLKLELAPYSSTFVVFRNSSAIRVASVSPDASATSKGGAIAIESAAGGTYSIKLASGAVMKATVPPLDPPAAIDGSWHVRFSSPAATPAEREFALLESWSASDDPILKHFSGHATYSKDIDIPASRLGPNKRLLLDLGTVGEIAEVWLNGKSLGTHWAPPLSVDITDAARTGANRLAIRVTNFWVNRLVGDAKLPPEQRTTRTNITQLPVDQPLMPSGLLGPLVLRSVGQAFLPAAGFSRPTGR
jgi:hypothetical protein